ncbi:MAG: hypothetical protein JSW07_13035 [bacterium]|nr:MAG: hypothetical protein JSW07_13035 [bacterium]
MNRFFISSVDIYDQIKSDFQESGGIYKLFCLENRTIGKAIAINRLLAIDKAGILYIGSTNCFLNRIIDLKKSLSPEHKTLSHKCGRLYKQNLAIRNRFKAENLCVILEHSEESDSLERMELEKYFQLVGEIPPFNGQY